MITKVNQKPIDLGGFPSDWKVVTLSELGSFRKGKNIPKASISSKGLPCILYGEIYTSYNFVAKKLISKIPLKVAEISSQITKGDILFAGSGETAEEIGKCVAYLGEEKAYAGGDLIILSPKETNSTFLGYLLNSQIVIDQKKNLGQGHSVVHIYSSNIKTIKTPLPPLPEQQAIAEALSDVDALISALDALIAKKRAIKQGVMQELLTGKRRLPGFSEKWKILILGNISEIKTGKKNNEEKVPNGEYPFFVRSQKVERINTYSFAGEAILIPGEGGIGNIIHYIDGKFDYHQRVYKISGFSESICGKFIYYLMKQLFFEQARRNSVKATVDSLRLPTFEQFYFYVPIHKHEQEQISNTIDDFDLEIEVLEQELIKTQTLKQGMMQELLTGRIRLMGGDQ